MRSFARGALAAYVLVMAVLFAWQNGWAINRITVWFYTRFLPYLGPQVLPEHYGLLFNVLAFTALVVLVCTAFAQLRVRRRCPPGRADRHWLATSSPSAVSSSRKARTLTR